MDLTKDEAYAIAQFIDMNLLQAIHDDEDWDNLYHLQLLIHGYEKCCKHGEFIGLTEPTKKEEE